MNDNEITYKQVLEYCEKRNYVLIDREFYFHITDKAISTKWIEKKITEYMVSGKYSSDAVPIVYALLSDWRKENK